MSKDMKGWEVKKNWNGFWELFPIVILAGAILGFLGLLLLGLAYWMFLMVQSIAVNYKLEFVIGISYVVIACLISIVMLIILYKTEVSLETTGRRYKQ